MKRHRKRESGFTLVELLVAIAVFGVILATVVRVFEVSNRSYHIQEEVAAMQQSVRVAKLFLERDVRMAGCGLKNFYQEDGKVYALDFANADGATGTDKITINYIDYDQTSCDGILPQLTLAGTMPAASSEAEISEELGNPPYSAWDNAFTCAGTTYGGTPFVEFKAIITSPDGSKSDVVYITTVQDTGGTDKLQNHPYGSFQNKVLNTYPAGSTINFFDSRKLVTVVYDVQDRVLRRNTQPLAEGIEDLQFSFGLDTNADDVVDTWINNANLTTTQKEQVRLVDINVLGRSDHEHRDYKNQGTRPAIEDHTASGTADGYRRKLLRVAVQVRNLAL